MSVNKLFNITVYFFFFFLLTWDGNGVMSKQQTKDIFYLAEMIGKISNERKRHKIFNVFIIFFCTYTVFNMITVAHCKNAG